MIRKHNRQRREYLYKRAQLLKDAEISEKRAKLRASLASGRPLAREDVDEGVRKDFAYDESSKDLSKQEAMDLDDEYSELSGVRDPQIIVTTSRDPSSRLAAFSKEIRLLFPTAIRLNRGNLVLPDLVSAAKTNEQTDVILLHEHRGQPSAITISHFPHGPTLSCSLHNVVLRHSIPNSIRGTVSESYPHLIFEGFNSKLGLRIVKILKHLFPPRDPTINKTKLGNRVISFVNQDDVIEVRHHVYVRTSYQSVELSEVGPRISMRPFQIRSGTLESKDGDVEWHLNNYTRTSRKKELL